MATNEVSRGPVSGYVVDNVKRLRAARRWSLADLSVEMEKVGRPILASGLHRVEQGKRRVDCDDLVALAVAFGVSPISLLLPPTDSGEIKITSTERADARATWDWMRARRPLTSPAGDEDWALIAFLRDSLPGTIRDRYPATQAGLQALQEDRPDVVVRRVADLPGSREVQPDGEH